MGSLLQSAREGKDPTVCTFALRAWIGMREGYIFGFCMDERRKRRLNCLKRLIVI